MKKLLFFIDTLGYGGAEKVLINLVNNLDKSKYDITLMTIFDGGVNKKYISKQIKYKYIFKKVFRGNVTLCKCFSPRFLYKYLIKDRYDIVISYLEGNTTRILSGCPYKETKKLAWIHVEMDEKTRFHTFRSQNECRECYDQFDGIVGVSQTVLDSFKQHMGNRYKTYVLYNTVDTDYIKNCADETVTDFEFNKKIPNLISVGRLIEQKSYMRLLRIHKRLIENGYIHNLFILGDGEQKYILKKYIDDNSLNNTAKLLGFRDNPWKYVKNSDLFVCSSLKEGFSTAVTEALIVGTPVVTTLCSGMEELLGESEYGLIVDNDEAAMYEGIKRLITDKKLLKQYKEMASKRGESFETKKTVQAVENLFDKLLGE